jgi:L-fuconolactonase
MERPGLESLHRPYTVDDLRRATGDAGVDRTVLVQTVSDTEETKEFLAVSAGAGGLVAGVVGWVDLCASDVADLVAALRAAPGGDRLVGVRHQVEDEPADDWFSLPAVRRGIEEIARCGLVYDLLVRPDQLMSAVALADALPDAALVLDHGAKPPIGRPGWDRWAEQVATLAQRDNVCCKLSGLFTQVPSGGRLTDVVPSAEHLLDLFGPQRLMIGSDWPVSTLAAPYPQVLAATHELLTGLTTSERADVVGGTAARTYRLVPP